MPQKPAKGKGKKSQDPQELMEQLMSMINQEDAPLSGDLEKRLTEIESRLAEIESRSPQENGPSEDLGQKLKQVINSVLLQSGFLEKYVTATVERTLEGKGGGGGGSGGGGGVDREMIRKELEGWMSSDHMKELFDDKFRAITLYIKSDVIPAAVRQALNNQT